MPRPSLKETRSSRWLDIEAARGMTMDVLIPALFQKMANRDAVAEDLGISPNTLDLWIDVLGLRYRVSSKTEVVPAIVGDDGEAG